MVCLTSRKNDAKLVAEALKVLGKDNLALIIHGRVFLQLMGSTQVSEHLILMRDIN